MPSPSRVKRTSHTDWATKLAGKSWRLASGHSWNVLYLHNIVCFAFAGPESCGAEVEGQVHRTGTDTEGDTQEAIWRHKVAQYPTRIWRKIIILSFTQSEFNVHFSSILFLLSNRVCKSINCIVTWSPLFLHDHLAAAFSFLGARSQLLSVNIQNRTCKRVLKFI